MSHSLARARARGRRPGNYVADLRIGAGCVKTSQFKGLARV